MKDIVIFDLDQTLALDASDRARFLRTEPKNWDAYYTACDKDVPNQAIFEVARGFDRLDKYLLLIWTGRREAEREKTREWLSRASQHGLRGYFDDLKMRPDDNHEPDYELKMRWLDEAGKDFENRILCVFEDRTRMVNAWRERGLTCFQVAPGDF